MYRLAQILLNTTILGHKFSDATLYDIAVLLAKTVRGIFFFVTRNFLKLTGSKVGWKTRTLPHTYSSVLIEFSRT